MDRFVANNKGESKDRERKDPLAKSQLFPCRRQIINAGNR